jgi:mono/diheme cytochrome c family protein
MTNVMQLWRLTLIPLAACCFALFISASARAAEAKAPSGLAVSFKAGEQTDTASAPGVTLFVGAGQPPTPFLPGGKLFTATWEGAILADLRGSFLFQAELAGTLKVEINGATVLDATNFAGGPTPISKPVQLNKGSNGFKAVFTSPGYSASLVRLGWTEKGTNVAPIPTTAFAHTVSKELASANARRLGRSLFLEHRCFKCHTDNKLAASGVPELKMDAPSLEGIGARRHYDWMARWILDPKALRPSARMPKLLHGATAQADAEAIAAYLASLKSGGEAKLSAVAYQTKQNKPAEGDEPAPAGDVKPLYERLHCIGCHNPPDAAQPDLAKLSQKRIAEKFPRGALAEYLRAPDAGYVWTRMPDFHLSAAEAKELEDYLFSVAPKPELKSAPTDAVTLEKGKKLVQTTGCLNCHAMKLENQFSAKKLADLNKDNIKRAASVPAGALAGDALASHWPVGCTLLEVKPNGKTPVFGFTTTESHALWAFAEREASTGFASLTRHVPAEFAERQAAQLNCTACHGQLEGFPALESLGGKLKPEWMAKFIAGDISHKIRYDRHPKGEPWLEARMPAFRSRATELARGLAAEAGFAPASPPEPAVNIELAKVGQKLVGKDGGFQCIACHGVGPLLAMDVFESEGINLAFSADRLQPSFFRRWLRAPTSVDPQTKMPVYFDEGKSPLTEMLDGDAERQIGAVWEYIRLRDKMPAPKTGAE